MNILFLSTTYPDAGAPARGTYNRALCEALGRRHGVRVIAPRPWPEMLRRRWRGGRCAAPQGETSRVACARPFYWYTPRVMRNAYGRFLWRSVRGTVERVGREFRPDAVLSYWAHPDGEAGLRAGQQFGVPHAVIVGGSDVLLLPRDRRRGARVRHVLRESDAVICVSDALRHAVVELGVDADRVHTIYQGIDREQFRPGEQWAARRAVGLRPDHAVLLWVGRMVDVKGLNVLIEACAELRSRGVSFELCLIGEGPLADAVRQQAASANVGDAVRFVGVLGPSDLPDWYRAADVTVLSSWSEGLPNVLRESLACGTPFVATDVGSIHEIAAPEYATLVPAGDPIAFAGAVSDMLGGNQRSAAQRYRARTWDECADATAALLQRLANGRTEPRPGQREIEAARRGDVCEPV